MITLSTKDEVDWHHAKLESSGEEYWTGPWDLERQPYFTWDPSELLHQAHMLEVRQQQGYHRELVMTTHPKGYHDLYGRWDSRLGVLRRSVNTLKRSQDPITLDWTLYLDGYGRIVFGL